MHRLALFLLLTGCSPFAISEGEHVAEKAAEGFVEAETGKQIELVPK
jgi:hypothetical protein